MKPKLNFFVFSLLSFVICTVIFFAFTALMRKEVEEARQLLLSEFALERTHHQKMVKDYTRLQQRFENLKGDMQVLGSPLGGPPALADSSGSEVKPEIDQVLQECCFLNSLFFAKLANQIQALSLSSSGFIVSCLISS